MGSGSAARIPAITAVTASPPDAEHPAPLAAAIWQDEPQLHERLRRRLASYAPGTQRALASDWRAWRTWCAASGRRAFPARPPDLVAYVYVHSPPLSNDPGGTVSPDLGARTPQLRRASTVALWLASLATLHRIAEVDDPTRHEDVEPRSEPFIATGRFPTRKKHSAGKTCGRGAAGRK